MNSTWAYGSDLGINPAALINTWRRIISGDHKSWVLFANGTCVIVTDPLGDLAAQAVETLRQYTRTQAGRPQAGRPQAGSPFGDFRIITLDPGMGWVVYGQHYDVLTYVGPYEVGYRPDDLKVGLYGRSKRHQDGLHLRVIHVEDRRAMHTPQASYI
jgi:hypothetical protein